MIKFSIETLRHFTCEKCNKWWSIGDWAGGNVMYCPHCGEKQEVDENSMGEM